MHHEILGARMIFSKKSKFIWPIFLGGLGRISVNCNIFTHQNDLINILENTEQIFKQAPGSIPEKKVETAEHRFRNRQVTQLPLHVDDYIFQNEARDNILNIHPNSEIFPDSGEGFFPENDLKKNGILDPERKYEKNVENSYTREKEIASSSCSSELFQDHINLPSKEVEKLNELFGYNEKYSKCLDTTGSKLAMIESPENNESLNLIHPNNWDDLWSEQVKNEVKFQFWGKKWEQNLQNPPENNNEFPFYSSQNYGNVNMENHSFKSPKQKRKKEIFGCDTKMTDHSYFLENNGVIGTKKARPDAFNNLPLLPISQNSVDKPEDHPTAQQFINERSFHPLNFFYQGEKSNSLQYQNTNLENLKEQLDTSHPLIQSEKNTYSYETDILNQTVDDSWLNEEYSHFSRTLDSWDKMKGISEGPHNELIEKSSLSLQPALVDKVKYHSLSHLDESSLKAKMVSDQNTDKTLEKTEISELNGMINPEKKLLDYFETAALNAKQSFDNPLTHDEPPFKSHLCPFPSEKSEKQSILLDNNNMIEDEFSVQYSKHKSMPGHFILTSHDPVSQSISHHSEILVQQLVFDPTAFYIDDPSHLDEYRIGEIKSIITNNSPHNLLKIDIRLPEKASKQFQKVKNHVYVPINKSRLKLKTSESWKQRFERRNYLATKAFKAFWSHKEVWSKFYKEKTGMEFQDHRLMVPRIMRFKTEDLEEHFVLFLFYVDMITSVIVNVEQGTLHEGTQTSSAKTVKTAAEKYGSYVLLQTAQHGRQYEYGKESFLSLVWETIEIWLKAENHSDLLYFLFQHPDTKGKSNFFFHAIFNYSVTRLSERITLG